MTEPDSPRARPGVALRHPEPADHARLVGHVDEWWGGRRLHDQFPRLWFEHFGETSWIAETTSGEIVGFLVGFRSPARPEIAHVHLVAASPNHRRRGIGRRLHEQFTAEMQRAGVRRIEAVTWPGNRASLAFHRALGFSVDDGPETVRLYGVPAYPDHDHPGEDRTRLYRDL